MDMPYFIYPFTSWWTFGLFLLLTNMNQIAINNPVHEPAIPLLNIYPREVKTGFWRQISIPLFIAKLFTVAKLWKQPRCPLKDKWISKMCHTHPEEYYSALKKKEILTYATIWINHKNIMLSEIHQSQKEKYCMISFTWDAYWSQNHRDKKTEWWFARSYEVEEMGN